MKTPEQLAEEIWNSLILVDMEDEQDIADELLKIAIVLRNARAEEREAIASDWDRRCPDCGGTGNIEHSVADHHPSCDGNCKSLCPIERQELEGCRTEYHQIADQIRGAAAQKERK